MATLDDRIKEIGTPEELAAWRKNNPLQKVLDENDMTAYALAKKMKVYSAFVYDHIRGVGRPEDSTIRRYARVFGLKQKDFIYAWRVWELDCPNKNILQIGV